MWTSRDIRALGVMVGSSMDGVDLAVCRFAVDGGWSLLRGETVCLSDEWKAQLRRLPLTDYAAGCRLDMAFGRHLGELIREWLGDDMVDLIGVHGYTAVHDPLRMVSVQLGSGRAVYRQTSVPTVDNFRAEDVIAGGAGAPLAPVVERDLFPGYGMFVNLGGIVNASWHGSEGAVYAKDLTGCNQIADALAGVAGMRMDRDGSLSVTGKADGELLARARSVRESLGAQRSISNEWVQELLLPVFTEEGPALADRIASLYGHVAESLAEAARQHRSLVRNRHCLITGGGAHNPVLMRHIREALEKEGYELAEPDQALIDFKESLLIAWMAYLHARNMPSGAWVWTGASRDDVAGTAYGL